MVPTLPVTSFTFSSHVTSCGSESDDILKSKSGSSQSSSKVMMYSVNKESEIGTGNMVCIPSSANSLLFYFMVLK